MIHLLLRNQQFVWFTENEKSDCVSTIALSWWRDSDPRPADYESAALPLSHTSILNPPVRIQLFYYTTRSPVCQDVFDIFSNGRLIYLLRTAEHLPPR